METSLIHESVKEKIFDMTLVKNLSDGIKRETRDYKLAIGDQGRTSSEIPESVIPTPASYRNATSPTPKRKPAATIKVQPSEDADASQPSGMVLEHGENADAGQASGHDGAHGENADASQAPGHDGTQGEDADASVPNSKAAENKQIEEIMNFVSEVYKPDDSKMFMRDSQQFVLPAWATDRSSAKCTLCGKMHKADRPEKGEEKLVCSICGGVLLIGEEVVTATSDVPWTTEGQSRYP